MRVPLHFLGEDVAPGVKLGGGVVSHHMIDLEIVCLPADLPEHIDIDVSKLGLGDAIHVQQVVLPKGVELAPHLQSAEQNYPVISIHAPTAEKEEASSVEPGAVPSTTGNAADKKDG